MVTEGVVKHEMIVQTIQWSLEKLRRAQLSQLNEKRVPIEQSGFNWDSLFENVSGRMDGIIGSNGHYQIVLPIDIRLRFADMKQLGGRKGPNAQVYNRPTWGVFFGRNDSVYTRLREGISDSIRNNILSGLRAAIEQKV